PPGLTISPDGLLSGVPTTEGVYRFSVIATDSYDCYRAEYFTLTITQGPPPTPTNTPSYTPSILPTATQTPSASTTRTLTPTASGTASDGPTATRTRALTAT